MRPSGNPALLNALSIVLKRRRLALGLTQEDVAGHAGIDRAYVTLIEAARKQPTLSVLFLLAQALNYRLTDFASEIDAEYEMSSRTREVRTT